MGCQLSYSIQRSFLQIFVCSGEKGVERRTAFCSCCELLWAFFGGSFFSFLRVRASLISTKSVVGFQRWKDQGIVVPGTPDIKTKFKLIMGQAK